MPYIYSLAWRVTNEDYTIQRPLLMDWRTDAKTRDIGDAAVVRAIHPGESGSAPNATHRTVYLPESRRPGTTFWTGTPQTGGQEIDAVAPLDRIPLYVRAGSILPLGPEIRLRR